MATATTIVSQKAGDIRNVGFHSPSRHCSVYHEAMNTRNTTASQNVSMKIFFPERHMRW